jgi:hypothetical protein
MFVAYLMRRDESRFKTLLLAIEDGNSFKGAFATAYGADVEAVWRSFVAEAKEQIH